MTARVIMRDPAVLDGRCHFAGTTVAVADVRAALGPGNPDQSADTIAMFARAGLNEDEVATARNFTFPAVRELAVDLVLASVVVRCVCGEDTPATKLGLGTITVGCACNRTWRITVEALDT